MKWLRGNQTRKGDNLASIQVNELSDTYAVIINDDFHYQGSGAMRVLPGFANPVVLAAALLHDTLEDTETHIDEITHGFGSAIASIVAEVTDDKSLPKAERKRLQVQKGGSKSHGAKLVKLADKIANLRDIAATPPPHWDGPRNDAYFDWVAEVVGALGPVNKRLECAFSCAFKGRPPATVPLA